MKTMKTFEAFLLECGKGDKPEMKEKKVKCTECGKKNCVCDKDKEEDKEDKE